MSAATNRLFSVLVAAHLRIGLPDAHALRMAEDLHDVLVAHFPGEFLYVSASVDTDRRDAEIIALYRDGRTIRAIARKLGLSKSHIHRIVRRVSRISG